MMSDRVGSILSPKVVIPLIANPIIPCSYLFFPSTILSIRLDFKNKSYLLIYLSAKLSDHHMSRGYHFNNQLFIIIVQLLFACYFLIVYAICNVFVVFLSRCNHMTGKARKPLKMDKQGRDACLLPSIKPGE